MIWIIESRDVESRILITGPLAVRQRFFYAFSMAKIVFILGAGASAQGGCPVMTNFFDISNRLYIKKRLAGYEDHYLKVERVRNSLERNRYKIEFDTNNMESVFNAIEAGIFLGRLGQLTHDELVDARASFIRLVLGVIENTQVFRFEHPNAGRVKYTAKDSTVRSLQSDSRNLNIPIGPDGHDQLAQLASFFIHKSDTVSDVSFITFNYDIGLEYALYARQLNFNYCLDTSPVDYDVRVFKLHGSLNWYRDDAGIAADLDVFRAIGEQNYAIPINPKFPRPYSHYYFKTSKYLQKTKGNIESLPIITPPSEHKEESRSQLSELWKSAAESLAYADNVIVIGYSLPSTDQFVRQFISLSLSNETDLRNFWVYDIAQAPISRFEEIIGLPIRSKFSGKRLNVSEATGEIATNYYLADECL